MTKEVAYGLSSFQRDLLKVLSKDGVDNNSGTNLFSEFVFHPTLTVQHYCPRELLLHTPLESFLENSACLNAFYNYLIDKTESVSPKSSCIVCSSTQHLDLIERVLLSLPNSPKIKRLSGLALLPQHTYNIPNDEELQMLQFLKKRHKEQLRFEEEEKKKIGKNKKRRFKQNGGTNNSDSVLEEEISEDKIERLSYVKKRKFILPNKDCKEDVFYLLTTKHLEYLGISKCFDYFLSPDCQVMAFDDSPIEYPAGVDVVKFVYTGVQSAINVKKDAILKCLESFETRIEDNEQLLREKNLKEFVRQEEIEMYKSKISDLFKGKWHNHLENEVEMSSKKVFKIEDDMCRLMKHYEEISGTKRVFNNSNENATDLEKEIEDLKKTIVTQNAEIEDLRVNYQTISNKALVSTQEYHKYDALVKHKKGKLRLLSNELQNSKSIATMISKKKHIISKQQNFDRFVQLFEKKSQGL